jgi:hypothetical protein
MDVVFDVAEHDFGAAFRRSAGNRSAEQIHSSKQVQEIYLGTE